MDVLITVCIPFYNDEKYLEYAIQSVINQTYQKWKLVLLDDGSTDNSLSIAKKFLYDSRVELVSDGLNKGLISRLNQSIDLVKTKYYARMDSDDIMHPNRLETQLKIMEENPKIDVLGTNVYSINENNVVTGIRYSKALDVLYPTKSFVHPSVMGHTKWFKSNPYCEYAIRREDTELWYRTNKNSCFYIINDPLLFYREFEFNNYAKYKKSIPSFFTSALIYFRKKRFNGAFHWVYQGVLVSLKFLVFFIFNLFGKESFLVKRRSLRIDFREKVFAENMLYESIKYKSK